MEIDDIYKNYMYDLYRYLFSLSKNHHTAEDLVQETFYRTYLSLPEQNITNIKAWLFKVAYHTFIDDTRKNKKQIPNEEIERLKDKESSAWTPEDQVLQNEEYQQLIEMVYQLRPKHQHAVILCDLHELTYEEGAQIMELNINSFKSNLYRGRQALMSKLNERRNQDE